MKYIKITTLVITIFSGLANLFAGSLILFNTKNESIAFNLYNGLPLVLAVLIGYTGFIIFFMRNKYLLATCFSAAGAITIFALGLRFLQIGKAFRVKTFILYHASALIIPIIALSVFLYFHSKKKKELDIAVAANLKKSSSK
ncbi:MAG: hypothetical protein RR497_00520 [Oscillospiraceae bacterium]